MASKDYASIGGGGARNPTGSTKSFPRPGGGMPKTIVVPIAVDVLYRTDGTTTYLVDIIDVPEVQQLGPMIKHLRVHYAAEGATTNFNARVSLAWSVLGRKWSSPVVVLAVQTGNQDGVIGAWYTTDANFGLQIRFAIEVANQTGAVIESGRVSAYVEIELKS